MNLELILYTILAAVLPIVITLVKGWLQKQGFQKQYNLTSELENAARLAIDYVEAWGKQLDVPPGSVEKLNKALQFINDNYKQLKKLPDERIKASIENKVRLFLQQ